MRYCVVLCILSLFSSCNAQCQAEEFSIQYDEVRAFSVSRSNFSCLCQNFVGRGSNLTNLDQNPVVASLTARLSAAEATIASLSTRLTTAENTITSLSTSLTNAENNITSLRGSSMTVPGAACTSQSQCPNSCCVNGVCSKDFYVSFLGGVGSYGILNPTSTTSWPTLALTISVWVRTTSANTAFYLSYATAASDNTWLIGVGSVYLNGVMFTLNPPLINDGLWHYVSVTLTTAKLATFYRDGVAAQSHTVSGTSAWVGGGAFVFAQEQDSVGGTFDAAQAMTGDIYGLNIWNVARSQAQIASDMANGITPTANLMMWLPTNENSGGILRDAAMKQPKGLRLVGAPWVSNC